MHFVRGYMFWDGITQTLSFCDLIKPWFFFFPLLKNLGKANARVLHGWALDLVFLSPYGMFGSTWVLTFAGWVGRRMNQDHVGPGS